MIPIPKIALVGRPNVGKSTLFNRICGIRKAITDKRPGSTRDRNYAQCTWSGTAFELIDTGGLLLQSDDPLLGPAADQARLAIAESELVVFLVDSRAGLLPDDQAIARDLRRSGKRVLLVVNKVEGSEAAVSEFARLGFESPFAISAEHGQGIGDLLDCVVSDLPRVVVPEEERSLRLALVGRPNVGKSSLLNCFLGHERALVSPIPGTTRDALDGTVLRGGRRLDFVDTAGIRRARLIKDDVDHVSVVQARRSIERADVVLVVLDAADAMHEMDATIAGYAEQSGRGVVLVANKWDLAAEKGIAARSLETSIRERLKFLAWAPLVLTSTVSGKGLDKVLATAERVEKSRLTRVTTGELNRLLGRVTAEFAPKADRGQHAVRLMFGTQVGIAPPTFVLTLSHDVGLHFSYRRYLENQLRAEFGFEGTPLIFKIRFRHSRR